MGRSQDQQVRALGEERCERVMARRKGTGGRREAQEAGWGGEDRSQTQISHGLKTRSTRKGLGSKSQRQDREEGT